LDPVERKGIASSHRNFETVVVCLRGGRDKGGGTREFLYHFLTPC
jgi:hypothetical protein